MKKVTKIFSLFITVFLFTGMVVLTSSGEKVDAAPAPGLSSFSIIGCSYDNLYNNNKQYIPTKNLSQWKCPKSTVYVLTNEEGYGRTSYSVDGGSYKTASQVEWLPRNGWIDPYSYGVVGWVAVDKITGLSSGKHTIRAISYNNGKGGRPSIADQITVTVQ